MNNLALTLIVGDVASLTPVQSHRRSDGASVTGAVLTQLSVTAVVVALSGASPTFVTSSAVQNVVRRPPESTDARNALGYR